MLDSLLNGGSACHSKRFVSSSHRFDSGGMQRWTSCAHEHACAHRFTYTVCHTHAHTHRCAYIVCHTPRPHPPMRLHRLPHPRPHPPIHLRPPIRLHRLPHPHPHQPRYHLLCCQRMTQTTRDG